MQGHLHLQAMMARFALICKLIQVHCVCDGAPPLGIPCFCCLQPHLRHVLSDHVQQCDATDSYPPSSICALIHQADVRLLHRHMAFHLLFEQRPWDTQHTAKALAGHICSHALLRVSAASHMGKVGGVAALPLTGAAHDPLLRPDPAAYAGCECSAQRCRFQISWPLHLHLRIAPSTLGAEAPQASRGLTGVHLTSDEG